MVFAMETTAQYLEMGLGLSEGHAPPQTAANLEMGLGLSEGHAPPQTATNLEMGLANGAARLRTASVRQDQRQCLRTASVRQDQRQYLDYS